MIVERLKPGVITVGLGRGFVVEGAGERLVITAAHCLPFLPPAQSFFEPKERIYGPVRPPRGRAQRVGSVSLRRISPEGRRMCGTLWPVGTGRLFPPSASSRGF